MKGRSLFRIIKPFTYLFKIIFQITPMFLTMFIWRLSDLLGGYLGNFLKFSILFAKAKKCGSNIYIGKHVEIKKINQLEIGSNVSIHEFCYIDCTGGLSISNNVSIAHNCSIMTENHSWSDNSIPIKYNPMLTKPVEISEDCWIGCGVRVLAGSKLNKRTIVAAGSVVNKIYEGNVIIGGIPGKIIKTL